MKIDYASLKKPLLSIVLLLVCCVISVSILWLRYEQTHKRFVGARTERDVAHTRYQRAESDLSLFQQYRGRFLSYQDQGVIGQENRLSWAEILHKQDVALSLPVFNVQISPRQILQKANTPTSIKWFRSTQSIKAELLHEGDLLQILQPLKEHAEGFFRVASCHLKRVDKIQLTPQASNINADCILHWYSLQIAAPREDSYVY